MADSQRRSSGTGAASRRQQHQKPSRLQRRAPATLQINRSSDWNVAIPLLSPLVSPSSPATTHDHIQNWTPDSASTSSSSSSQPEKPPVFKKWQHPAAPFHYDSASTSRAPRFVPV